jgi:hypothetical protein
LKHHFTGFPCYIGAGSQRTRRQRRLSNFFFSQSQGGGFVIGDCSPFFSHASALSSGSNGFLWGTGWRAFAVFGGQLGSPVRARLVPLVITLGSALSLSLFFLVRISSHLIPSCRTNPISLLSFPRISSSRRPFQRSAKQGAWSGKIADLHSKGCHSKPHVSSTHRITLFSISPFLTTANLAGLRTTTASRSIGRVGC